MPSLRTGRLRLRLRLRLRDEQEPARGPPPLLSTLLTRCAAAAIIAGLSRPKQKKSCSSCGKSIPRAAHNCAFCGVKQVVASLDTAAIQAIAAMGTPAEAAGGAGPPAPVETKAIASPPTGKPEALKQEIPAPRTARETAQLPALAVSTPKPEVLSLNDPPQAAPQRPLGLRGLKVDVAKPAPKPGERVHTVTAPMPTAVEPPRTVHLTPRDVAAVAGKRLSQTGETLFGVQVDTDALVAASRAAQAKAAEAAAAEAAAAEAKNAEAKAAYVSLAKPPPGAKPAPEPAVVVEPTPADPDEDFDEEGPAVAWELVGRAVMAMAGVVLLGLYATSYPLMVALAGPQLVLQHYALVAGLVLIAGGLMTLPTRFRAGLAAAVGVIPLFVVGPSVGGFGGWRGLAAAMVFCLLPGALLLRSRATESKLARGLVAGGVALVALLYVVPVDGVVPFSAVWSLLVSSSFAGVLTGAIFGAPLLLAAAALTAFAGRDSTGFGALWAALVLLLGPGAIIAAGVADDETSLVHIGVALLAAGATAATGVAELLDPSPRAA
ncbi:MAG: hypothetical protein EXR72_26465 [Myxococcales bacterium]|nr:hypothetical protein [Myxococcales bacterium]